MYMAFLLQVVQLLSEIIAHNVWKMLFSLRFQEVDSLWSLEENLSSSKSYQFVHVVGGYDLLRGLLRGQSMCWPQIRVNHLVSTWSMSC